VIVVQRSGARKIGGGPGIETRRAFSFGGDYDVENLSFGVLTACNEERLGPGAGFEAHLHRDVEIVTWVIEGHLTHQDASGGTHILGPGRLQRLTAGSGVRHVERNDSESEPLRFLQMWLHPADFGGEPQYEAADEPAPVGTGLRRLASPFRQPEATLYVGHPPQSDRTELPAAPYLYVHVIHGTVRLNGVSLGPGDAARISDETGGVTAETDGAAEYLVWKMHAVPTYG
jgi:redox-sensitive bicupin YhaK (pirin superfamily)